VVYEASLAQMSIHPSRGNRRLHSLACVRRHTADVTPGQRFYRTKCLHDLLRQPLPSTVTHDEQCKLGTRWVSAAPLAPAQVKLSRNCNQIARGRIRQFESYMASQAVQSPPSKM
jgi:hypothetical protein